MNLFLKRFIYMFACLLVCLFACLLVCCDHYSIGSHIVKQKRPTKLIAGLFIISNYGRAIKDSPNPIVLTVTKSSTVIVPLFLANFTSTYHAEAFFLSSVKERA